MEALTEEEANRLEIEYIEKYHTCIEDPMCYGYNIRPGGLATAGWHHTEETKEKLRIASSKPKNKLSSKYGKHYGRTTIYQYDLDGKLVNSYVGYYEAAKKLDMPRDSISDCANGHSKTCYGFTFSKTPLTKEEVINKIAILSTRPPVTIYHYDKNYTLCGIYATYTMAVKESGIKESSIESVIEGYAKTAHSFVFSKRLLTDQELASHYIKEKRKAQYKVLQFSLKNKLLITYNSIAAASSALGVSYVVMCNVLQNKTNNKLTKNYIFKKEITKNEN